MLTSEDIRHLEALDSMSRREALRILFAARCSPSLSSETMVLTYQATGDAYVGQWTSPQGQCYELYVLMHVDSNRTLLGYARSPDSSAEVDLAGEHRDSALAELDRLLGPFLLAVSYEWSLCRNWAGLSGLPACRLVPWALEGVASEIAGGLLESWEGTASALLEAAIRLAA